MNAQPLIPPATLQACGAMPTVRTFAELSLVSKDDSIAARNPHLSNHFELTWTELEGSEWVRHVRQLGPEGRALIGRGLGDPVVMEQLWHEPARPWAAIPQPWHFRADRLVFHREGKPQ